MGKRVIIMHWISGGGCYNFPPPGPMKVDNGSD